MSKNPVEFQCACGARYSAAGAGPAKCPVCGQRFPVPDLSESILGSSPAVHSRTMPYLPWMPADAAPPDFQVGDSVLGVRIEKILQGGMGEVYLGWSDDLDMRVAMKSYRIDWATPEARAAFEQEAATWIEFGTAADHVVRAWGYYTIQDRPLVMMEFVDGGDLQSRLDAAGSCLRIDQALDVALQFCRGMIYLWEEHGVVHGDIKPQNILFEQNGHLRISDFGLSGVVGQVHGGLGTCPFMPPEQFRPDSVLGTGADIYAFGVMLYVTLTGFSPLPFTPSATPEDFQRIHETEPYQPLSDLSPRREEILEALDKVIGRCLEKDVRKRWPDFGVVFAELENLYRRFIGSPWNDCPSESPTMTSHITVRQGQMDLARGDAQAALEKAERVLGAAEAIKDIENVVIAGANLALSLKQNALFALERFQEALEVNDQLLKLAPHNSTIHMSRLDILKALGREEQDPALRTLRARTLLTDNRLGAAMTEVEQLLGTEADYVQLFLIRATAYLALELNQLADQTAQDVLFMDPENPEAKEIQSMAQSREQPGETDPAVLRRMAGERANEYLRSERYDEAEDWALLALTFEHHPDEGNLLVIALLMREELAQAEIVARELCDRYPERPDCWYNLAQSLVLNDEKTEARTILERLREFDPDDDLVNRLYEEIS